MLCLLKPRFLITSSKIKCRTHPNTTERHSLFQRCFKKSGLATRDYFPLLKRSNSTETVKPVSFVEFEPSDCIVSRSPNRIFLFHLDGLATRKVTTRDYRSIDIGSGYFSIDLTLLTKLS